VRRRDGMTLLAGGAAVGWPVATHAQQPMVKVYRLGMLKLTPGTQNATNFDALHAGLRELGYVDRLPLDRRPGGAVRQ
jgi:hypothetical protein